MRGVEWRLLLVNANKIVFPSILDSPRKNNVIKIFEILGEIQWIAYSEPWVRKYKGIKLRLHVLCFELCIQIKNTYEINSFGEGLLPLHTMISHYGQYYEEIDFRNSSTESGEGKLNFIHFLINKKNILQSSKI